MVYKKSVFQNHSIVLCTLLSFQGAKSMPLSNLCEVKRSCVSPEIGRTWVFLIRKVLHWRQKWLPKGHFQCYLKRAFRQATNSISSKQEIWRENLNQHLHQHQHQPISLLESKVMASIIHNEATRSQKASPAGIL